MCIRRRWKGIPVQEGSAVYVYGGAVVVVVVVLSVWIYGAKSKITVPAPYG